MTTRTTCQLAIAALFGIGNTLNIQAQSTTSPAFEVASVKPNKSGDLRNRQMQSLPGGRLVIKNIPLRMIVARAYNVPPFNAPWRLAGGPEWINSENFDIEATAAAGVIPAGMPEKLRNEKINLMLQSLLADRFKLALHRETKELPVYALTIAKNGPKLQKPKIEEKDCPEVSTPAAFCHMLNGGQGNGAHGKSIDMAEFTAFVEAFSDRPVIDKTGFTGLFDIDTEGWVPLRPRPLPPPGKELSAEDLAFADPARPTLGAVLDKVGLRLEQTKASVETIVIDNVERPAAN
jgi:uncharacterized protein (TIGR03435 family)